MPAVHVVSGPLDDERRAELVFRGDLVIFKQLRSLAALSRIVEPMIHATLEEPAPDDYGAAVLDLQRRFAADPDVSAGVRDALREVGVDESRTCWDRLYLRVQPPSAGAGTGDAGTLGVHRDTWSSNVYEQVNWWTPIRPITSERTIAFYPAYWARPIANTSAGWDLDDVRARRKAGDADVPLVPEPSEPLDTADELRVVIEPGDLLCFSGAHLHRSVPNTSADTRFNVEIRTVNLDDVQLGRRAPNVDGNAPRVPLEWFRRITDGVPLPALAGDLHGDREA